ncbi:MAG TPA: segregation/condensation protein A [Candidatus Nanoarchaeia archaeon]|nr:segregation/condensation protein A [Candidatus Nanoarchaeia archaeon]
MSENSKEVQKVGQEQIHGLLFGDTLSWQAIIYDLINTEQLDAWDIDISLLANKYLEKVRMLEEANFFVSSKVLLAAALLLRIKSEILLNEYLPSLDEILFGKKEEKPAYIPERIELEGDIPGLVPRTPLPRFRKVGLEELMEALGKAIATETRRIRKVIVAKQQEYETALSLPKNRINLQDRIVAVDKQLNEIFKDREEKVAFSEISGETYDEKLGTFVPLLHLDNAQKVWLEQNGHLEEIWILLKHLYEKQNKTQLEIWKAEVEEALKETNTDEPVDTKALEDDGPEKEDRFEDRRPIADNQDSDE